MLLLIAGNHTGEVVFSKSTLWEVVYVRGTSHIKLLVAEES